MKKRGTNFSILSLMMISAVISSCISSNVAISNQQDQNKFSRGLYLIKNVSVSTMSEPDSILPNANVVVSGNKILSINGPVPGGAVIINGSGKWLIPGLIDMHVHNLADINLAGGPPSTGANFILNTQDFMWLYVANGITTGLELGGRTEHMAERNEIVSGKIIGPRLAISALINAGNGDGFLANTPEDGRQIVRTARSMGFDFIKPYSALSAETFKAIVDEAGKLGMKTVGHIPGAFRDKLEQVFVPDFSMVAHAEEFSRYSKDFSDDDAHRFAKMAKANNTWLSPTLITMVRIAQQTATLDSVTKLSYFDEIHPLMQSKWTIANRYFIEKNAERLNYFNRMVEFHYRMVRIFHEEGVPIVAGTDAGTSGVVWGYALHDELEQLVKAGLDNKAALAAATSLAAEWLQLGDKLGTIEEGKWADLILLDANPLENISNTRKISGVFFDGRWVSRRQIDENASRSRSGTGKQNKTMTGRKEKRLSRIEFNMF